MTVFLQSTVAYRNSGGSKKAALQHGFTLLELVIVIAIIGILVAVAIPAYENSVVKTNRKAMTGCMLEAAQFMERFYTTNLRYDQTAAATPVANAIPTLNCRTDLTSSYTMTIPTLTATTYTVQATPVGRQLAKDTLCGTLTVNQGGARTEAGTASTPDECWAK